MSKEISKWNLFVFVGSCVFFLLVIDAFVRSDQKLIQEQREGKTSKTITVLSKIPANISTVKNIEKSVLLVGNSHVYAFPGLEKGQPLRIEKHGDTILSILANELNQRNKNNGNLDYRQLAYPNLLPLEMLTVILNLYYKGYEPNVVILCWSWFHLARHRSVRYRVNQAFRKESFWGYLQDKLTPEIVSSDHVVLAALKSERQKIEEEVEAERLLSHADRLETEVRELLSPHLGLLKDSTDVRARIARGVVQPIQKTLAKRRFGKYVYGVIDTDLQFNKACWRILLRFLATTKSKVIIYTAPERDDLIPAVDPLRQDEELAGFREFAMKYRFSVVDARRTVDSKLFGWAGDYPDGAHFTEAGHVALANQLLEAGKKNGLWKALELRFDHGQNKKLEEIFP